MSDQKVNHLLVKEVKKRPILYNFHLPGYSNKHETEKAWIEVGNTVKLPVMGRKYKTKSGTKVRKRIPQEELEEAIKEIKNGASVRSTASKYNISRTTLGRILKSGEATYASFQHSKVFTTDEEEELATYLLNLSNLNHGLTLQKFKQLAFQYAKANQKKFPQSWNVKEEAGQEWCRGFLERNSKIALRKPEDTSLTRGSAFMYRALTDTPEKDELVAEQEKGTKKSKPVRKQLLLAKPSKISDSDESVGTSGSETDSDESEEEAENVQQANECKEKWKNIRAVFVRHMKPPPSGARTKKKKAYYLSDAMQFAIPYIKVLGQASGNVPQEEEAVEDDETSLDALMKSEPPSPLAPTLQLTVASSSDSSSPEVELPDEQITSRIPSKKRALSNTAVDQGLIQYSDRKGAKQTVAEDSHTEGLKMFLLSMLPDLQKMSDQQVRQFKRKALDAIDEIFSNSQQMSSLISPSSALNSSTKIRF